LNYKHHSYPRHILHRDLHLVVVLDIDNRLLPLASGHLAVEQDVDLTVRPALHLGQVEVGHEEADETGTSPHVTALAAEVCTL
jgi:hypothetical protein